MAKSDTLTQLHFESLDDLMGFDFSKLDGVVLPISCDDLAHLKMQARSYVAANIDMAERTRKAEAVAMDLNAKFVDLKERLHEAEVSKSRLEGYLDRVAQDDHAVDGYHVVTDPSGMGADVEAKPKRPNQGYRAGYMGGQSGVSGISAGAGYSDRAEKRRVHWTSY